MNNGGLYEWYTPEGAGKGSINYTGSAGVLGECIIEGYFGISLSHDTLSVSPRLGDHNGSIILAEPTSGTVISYNYRYIPDNECIFEYQSNYPDTLINIMIPQEPDPRELIIDGKPSEYSIISVENEKYISFKLIKGTHNCSLIL